MAYGNSAEAYDFSLFEERGQASSAARQVQPKKEPKGKILEFPESRPVSRNKGKLLRAAGTVLCVAVILGLVVNLIHSQVVLTELTDQITTAQAALSEQQGVAAQLQAEQAAAYALPAVEERAEEMGMRKVSQSQLRYFSVSEEDQGTVIREAESKDWLTLFFESIWSWES